jgi:hypothetical protein
MLARTLEKKYARALAWVIFAACMHPLMWVFPFSFCLLLIVLERFDQRLESAAVPQAAALSMPLSPVASPAYHEAAKAHGFHYIQRWAWYEQLGAVAPLFLFGWFAQIARARQWRVLERVSRIFVVYGLIYLVGALAVDLPARFEALARLQPLRSLHFLYIVMFVVIGGLLGEYVLRARWWRWLVFFLPLSVGMFLSQRALFSDTAHIEWPGVAPSNPWEQAFLWVRENTPVNAVFALDPYYMQIRGEDEIGFRCMAERSRLADGVKDNGVVSMFPPLAEEWWAQVQAQTPWRNFRAEDFVQLKQKYGANWIVTQTEVSGLDCVYQNHQVRVCRLPSNGSY